MKKGYSLIGMLVFVMILSACGGSNKSAFPSGKFMKEGSDNYGLIINEDGTFSVFSGPYTQVRATFSVEGNVFTETSNDSGCETNVAFNYTFDGSKLTFTYAGDPSADKCDGRRTDFNNVTYILSK